MTRPRIALLICTTVIGGHEYQAAAFAKDFAAIADVTVFVNRTDHAALFASPRLQVHVLADLLLRPGPIPFQVWDGFRRRHTLRSSLAGYDQVVISAGAIEAGVAASLALKGQVPLSLYLPSFYDRVAIWGRLGHVYNVLLRSACRVYNRILTINRIQARVIQNFSGIATSYVPNLIRSVGPLTEERLGKLVFIGRIDKNKRLDELLQWVDGGDHRFAQILVIGDGPERTGIEAVAAGMQRITAEFKGWLNSEEQDRLLSSNDVLLLNSVVEGEPLVIREARMRGMRVLARDITGVRGVTSRTERFGSLAELQASLAALGPLHTAAPARFRQPVDLRARCIQRFLTDLSQA